MKQYIGIWTTKKEMVQAGYKESLEFYAECGATSIVVGYEGAHPEYYKGLKLPLIQGEETEPTLKEICEMASDVGLDVEVVIDPKNSVFASKYPETAITDVLGNKSTLVPCPSNPDIMAYTKARIRDIIENYDGIMGLELDGVYIDMHQRMTNRRDQPGAFYPLHHIVPESCFCEHCRKIAEEEGINLKRIEETVKEKITERHIVRRMVLLEASEKEIVKTLERFSPSVAKKEREYEEQLSELFKKRGLIPEEKVKKRGGFDFVFDENRIAVELKTVRSPRTLNRLADKISKYLDKYEKIFAVVVDETESPEKTRKNIEKIEKINPEKIKILVKKAKKKK